MCRKAIIWSTDNFNSLALLRQLGQKRDLDIFFLILGKRNYAYKSMYCKDYCETASLEDGLKFLLSHFACESDKPVIFTSGDNIMIFMEKHINELEKFFIVPGCKNHGFTEKYTDKVNMNELARAVGFYVPYTIRISKNSLFDFKYPCLIKPSHEVENYYNEFKFKICYNEKQLKNILKKVRESSVFALQEYIKCEKQLLVYGTRTFNGDTICAGAMIVDRFTETGSSSHGIIIKDFEYLVKKTQIIAFVEKINYYGLFSFEFGIKDGKAFFFEINLRNDGTSNFFFQSGSNIPLSLYMSCCDNDFEEQVHISVIKEGQAIDDLFDYENVMTRRLSKKEYKNDLKIALFYKYNDPLDREPYLVAKKKRYMEMTKDIILKKYRLTIVNFLTKLGLRK